jgi:hypothetical protein
LLLKVVAVAGGRVPHQPLAAVAGLDDRQLDGALRAAVTNLLGSGGLDWSDSAAEVAAHWGRAHDLSKALEWSVRAAFASSALASRPPR